MAVEVLDNLKTADLLNYFKDRVNTNSTQNAKSKVLTYDLKKAVSVLNLISK